MPLSKRQVANVGMDGSGKGNRDTTGGKVHQCRHHGEQSGAPPQMGIVTTMWSAIPSLSIYSKGMKLLFKRNPHSHVYCSRIYSCQDTELLRYPLTDEWIKKNVINIYNRIILSHQNKILSSVVT